MAALRHRGAARRWREGVWVSYSGCRFHTAPFTKPHSVFSRVNPSLENLFWIKTFNPFPWFWPHPSAAFSRTWAAQPGLCEPAAGVQGRLPCRILGSALATLPCPVSQPPKALWESLWLPLSPLLFFVFMDFTLNKFLKIFFIPGFCGGSQNQHLFYSPHFQLRILLNFISSAPSPREAVATFLVTLSRRQWAEEPGITAGPELDPACSAQRPGHIDERPGHIDENNAEP